MTAQMKCAHVTYRITARVNVSQNLGTNEVLSLRGYNGIIQ